MTCPSSSCVRARSSAGASYVAVTVLMSSPREREEGHDDHADPQEDLLGGVDAGVRAHESLLSRGWSWYVKTAPVARASRPGKSLVCAPGYCLPGWWSRSLGNAPCRPMTPFGRCSAGTASARS